MQTYYKLEDYHWDKIKKKNFIKGKKVWFVDMGSYDKVINEGIITGHSMHIEGYIELQLRVTKKYDKYAPDHIWVDDESKRKEIDSYSYIKNAFMDNCFSTKEETIERAKSLIKLKIRRLESDKEDQEKILKELENM